MKRWKKYVFCVICACCVGLLAGCGNKNDGVTQNGKATEAMPETKENRKETPKAEINDKRATEPEETTVNDATDRSDTDTGVGGAAKDIVDGVGDAVFHLLGEGNDLGAALGGLLPVHAVQGEVTADRGQKRKEILGSPGRDAFPDFGIGVVDAFLGILPVLPVCAAVCRRLYPFPLWRPRPGQNTGRGFLRLPFEGHFLSFCPSP